MRIKFVCILSLVCALSAAAQSPAAADSYFQEGDYHSAQQAYGKLLKSNPKYPLYLYRYARCAQELGDYATAIAYFDKAGDKYALKYFYLGEIYMHLWHPEEAIRAYQTYLQTLKTPNEREAYIRARIRYAEKQTRYLRRVEKVQITDSVDVALDSMVYVCALSAEAGSLTADTGGLVYTNQRGDRRLWAAERDSVWRLVSAQRFMDQWSVPDTLPAVVQTGSRQMSPYVLSDGVTLYFASNDSNGLGGLDLYVTRYNTAADTYTHPENLGYPYNSEANEYMMVIDENRHVGYFATDRFSEKGRVRVYSFVPTDNKEYWRNVPQDTIAAYARMERTLTATARTVPEEPQPAVVTQQNEEEDTIRFVLNDSTVYTSPDDFRNPAAREMYTAWQQATEEWQTQAEELETLRLQYSTADAATRRQLAPRILQIEQSQAGSAARSREMLNEVRKAENKTTNK